MRRLLHIVTKSGEPLALEIIQFHRQQPDCEVMVVDLTQPEADYETLLENIFAADSVQVW